MINRLFVYGTLGPGQSHEHLLTQVPGRWEKASLNARLYPNGKGVVKGYPVLEIDDQAEAIQGFVYFSRQLASVWPQLDTYEGKGYKRVAAKVNISNQQRVTAWVYCYDNSLS